MLHSEDAEYESDYEHTVIAVSDQTFEPAAVESETPLTPLSPTSPTGTPNRKNSRAKFPSELKTIKCTYEGCEKTFNRPARLVSHLRSHTNERPFICTWEGCDKAYLEEKHLKQHIKGTHTHERNHVCDWEDCTKSFLTATRLRRHQAAHQGHERFRCTEYPPCNQTFRKHQTLQRHIRADHLSLTPFPCKYVDPATQIPCKAGYDSAGALRKHEDRVHSALRFWCDECKTPDGFPVGFCTKRELNTHMKREHADCVFCDKKFNSEKELMKHVDAEHTKAPAAPKALIPCTHFGCPKTFTKKYNLDVHVRTAHEGQRYVCGSTDLSKTAELESWDASDACGDHFVSKVNLVDHVRTQHLGLPSKVNARRLKKKDVAPETVTEPKAKTEDVEDPTSALTGIGYVDARDITCLVAGCEYRFHREYDRILHLRGKHGFIQIKLTNAPQLPFLLNAARTVSCGVQGCGWAFYIEDEVMVHRASIHGRPAPPNLGQMSLSETFRQEQERGEHKFSVQPPDLPPQDLIFDSEMMLFVAYTGPQHLGRDFIECSSLGCQHLSCVGEFGGFAGAPPPNSNDLDEPFTEKMAGDGGVGEGLNDFGLFDFDNFGALDSPLLNL